MRIEWQPNVLASALNAARQITQGKPLASAPWNLALKPLAEPLHRHVVLAFPGVDSVAWCELVNAAAHLKSIKVGAAPANGGNDRDTNVRQIVQGWLSASDQSANNQATEVNAISRLVSDIELATLDVMPQANQQLALRLGPLQQQWDGYGAALMAHMRRLIGCKPAIDRAIVLAVQPIVGGDGLASPLVGSAFIEAVLTNPLPDLPEVLRLAWLVGQLGYFANAWDDRSITEAIAISDVGFPIDFTELPVRLTELRRQADVLALAMIPATLAAAEVVELAKCNEATVQLALDQFAPRRPDVESLSRTLLHWWETLLQTKPSWAVALAALDRTLTSIQPTT